MAEWLKRHSDSVMFGGWAHRALRYARVTDRSHEEIFPMRASAPNDAPGPLTIEPQ
jgi:hypothetical protein